MKVEKIIHQGRKYQVLLLSQLFIDLSMGQRQTSASNIAGIRIGYDRHYTRVLVVSKRGRGRYAVLDGQHRLVVMREKLETHAICEIHEGLTIEQEARLFEHLNRNKPLKGIELFVAQYSGGDLLARKVTEIVRKHGFELPLERGKKKYGKTTIRCGSTLYKLAQDFGVPAFDTAFSVIAECFKTDRGGIQTAALKGDFLPGLFNFLKLNDVPLPIVKAALKGTTSDKLLGEAYKLNSCDGKRCGYKLPLTLSGIIKGVVRRYKTWNYSRRHTG